MNTKTIVLSRVHTIHALRPFVSQGAVSLAVFLGALWGIGKEVWVAKIVANMPSLTDIGGLVNFFLDAFMTTSFSVQILSVLVVAALIYTAREMAAFIGTPSISSVRASL
jgi:hypothetical protein